jgi:DNA polymerase III delta prime subunit
MDFYNSTTLKWIEAYLRNPKATTIIETNNDLGTGLEVAQYLYSSLVKSKSVPFYKLEIKDKKSIGIEDVKGLKEYFSLKANSDGEYTRFAVIPRAELLTNEAQNALLKLIEELPERTVLVLIVNDASKVLNTISSRCFVIKLLPIEYDKAREYAVRNNFSDEKFTRSYLLSEGNASLFIEYISGESSEIDNVVRYSKEFISSSVFDRQNILSKYSKEEYTPIQLIKSIQLVSKSTMRNARSVDSKRRWKEVLEKSILAEDQLNSNVNSKLVLLNLSVSI